MIFDTISNAGQYGKLHPLFPRVFEYIRNNDLKKIPPGRHSIIGEDVFLLIQHVAGTTRDETKLECHRKYIDIQLVLDGVDEMAWKPLADCKQEVVSYDATHDVQFFEDKPTAWITTPANKFCIFFPEDAHAALVSEHYIHKAVFKIAMQSTGK